MIDSSRVTGMLDDCLFKDDEIVNGIPAVEPVKVEGVLANFGLHPDRLLSHKEEIKEMLSQFPKEFMKDGGGGWTFLNLCNTADGQQWTDLHQVMEQLVVLGIGSGFVKYTMNKRLWSSLPGGMPYVSIDLSEAIPDTPEEG